MNHNIIVFVIKQYASAILTRHQVSSAVIVTQTAQSYETLARVSQTSQISFENLTVSLSHSNSLHVKLCLTFSDVTRLTYTSPAKSICFYLFLVPFSLEMQTAIFFLSCCVQTNLPHEIPVQARSKIFHKNFSATLPLSRFKN